MSRSVEAALIGAMLAAPAAAETLGIGRVALPPEVAAWNIDVRPDGQGLPDGKGSVAEGEAIFDAKCAACHGDFGEGSGPGPALAGGQGSLRDARPLKTIGSYWPQLSTAFDYIRRAQPFNAPGTLKYDEVYAVLAYLLELNDLVPAGFVLSRANFATVHLPNERGFYPDDRESAEASFRAPPCMAACGPAPRITRTAAAIDVTPGQVAPAPQGLATNPADPAQVAAGGKLFKLCGDCHQIGPGAGNGVGPALTGIVGRKVASVPDYRYSDAMAAAGAAGKTWTAEALDAFLRNPLVSLPGTKMAFAGVDAAADRAALIAWLASQP